jgi:hypothetical protein
MPALPDVAKVLKVVLTWTDGVNTDIITRFFLRYTGTAPTDAELVTFCTGIGTVYVDTGMAALQHSTYTLTGIEATDLTSPTSAIGAEVEAVVGSRSGGVLDSATSAVISFVIARRYRGGHPRAYLPFGTSTDLLNAQQWTPDFVSALDGTWAAFFTAIFGIGWTGFGALEHVNVSYYQGFTVFTNPITGRARNIPTVRGAAVVDQVSTHITRPKIGTQRRRLQYG